MQLDREQGQRCPEMLGCPRGAQPKPDQCAPGPFWITSCTASAPNWASRRVWGAVGPRLPWRDMTITVHPAWQYFLYWRISVSILPCWHGVGHSTGLPDLCSPEWLGERCQGEGPQRDPHSDPSSLSRHGSWFKCKKISRISKGILKSDNHQTLRLTKTTLLFSEKLGRGDEMQNAGEKSRTNTNSLWFTRMPSTSEV